MPNMKNDWDFSDCRGRHVCGPGIQTCPWCGLVVVVFHRAGVGIDCDDGVRVLLGTSLCYCWWGQESYDDRGWWETGGQGSTGRWVSVVAVVGALLGWYVWWQWLQCRGVAHSALSPTVLAVCRLVGAALLSASFWASCCACVCDCRQFCSWV